MKDYKKGICDSCGCEELPVIKTTHRFLPYSQEETKITLCEICYTTAASKPYLYPNNHLDSRDVISAMTQIANILRNDIKKLANSQKE